MRQPATITRNILLLSIVSLCTDMASEMLYPMMPGFLHSIGYPILLIGLMEGLAEAIAGLSKSYFGYQSDLVQKRLPFIRLGYLLSAVSKPLMALSFVPGWIFSTRLIDRLGKGIRTAPRDAMLRNESNASNRGAVFGFHRSMDTIGAVIGPLIALALLHYFPGKYALLFIIAALPGILAIASTWLLKEKEITKPSATKLVNWTKYWARSPKAYRQLLLPIVLFACINSSDMFLLLYSKQCGNSDTTVILMYIAYNLVFASLAYPAGKLADRLGLPVIFITGLLLFALVYGGFSMFNTAIFLIPLFIFYGIYAALTDGVAKAMISNTVTQEEAGTALGTYAALQSLAALVASLSAAIIWQTWGASFAFGISAIIALIAAIWLWFILKSNKKEKN